MRLFTFLHPFLLSDEINDFGVAILVDVLRASTTINAFFEKGGKIVIPVITAQEAFHKKEINKDALLCGEFMAQKYQSFDLNNSPSAIMKLSEVPEIMILCTTNMVSTLQIIKKIKHIFFASFWNYPAIVEYIMKNFSSEKIALICCGKKDGEKLSFEDVMLASHIIRTFISVAPSVELSEVSLLVMEMNWSTPLETYFEKSPSVKRILDNDCKEDLLIAFKKPFSKIIPYYDHSQQIIKSHII